MYALDQNQNFAGSFVPNANTNQQTLGGRYPNTCPGNTAIGHNTNLGGVTNLNVSWVAATVGTGPVTFVFYYSIGGGSPYGSFSATSGALTEAAIPSGVTVATSTHIAPGGTGTGTGNPVGGGGGGGGGGVALSAGAIAGIVIGVVAGIVILGLIITPIVYARVKKDDRFSRASKNRA